MTIKQQGGIFGRNPTFNDVTVDGTLTVDQIVEKTGAAGITLDNVTLKDGNVVLGNGKGIDFSATSDASGMSSELFSDYEEGTWTIECADAASGGNVSATTGTGYYTKIGNTVTIWGGLGNISTAGLTSGNVFYIRGLPYNCSQGARGSIKTDSVNFQAANGFLTIEIGSGTSFVIKQCNDNAVDTNTTVANIASGTADIGFTLTYMV